MTSNMEALSEFTEPFYYMDFEMGNSKLLLIFCLPGHGVYWPLIGI